MRLWSIAGISLVLLSAGSLLAQAPHELQRRDKIELFLQHLGKVALQMGGVSGGLTAGVYYAIPHLEFYDLRSVVIHNWEAREWGMVALASVYGAAYTAAFLVLGRWLFRRKVLTQ